jgi:hypothetical protein
LMHRQSPIKAHATGQDDEARLAAMGQRWPRVLAAITRGLGFVWGGQAVELTTDRSWPERGTTMRPVCVPDLLAGVVSLGIVFFLWLQ